MSQCHLARLIQRAAIVSLLAGLTLGAEPARAQPEASLTFEGVFGQRGTYHQCSDEDRTFCVITCEPDRGCIETCFCSAGTTNTIPPEGFTSPTGIDWLDSDTLIIADRGNNKLQRCSMDGWDCNWIGGDSGTLRNQSGIFTDPHGVEVSPAGLLAVADEGNHAMQVTNALGSFRYSGDNSSESNVPACTLQKYELTRDVAFDPQGRIYVIDACDRIKVLRDDANLFVLGQYAPPPGSQVGRFMDPRGIAIDAQGRLIIADTGNHRIQVCEQGAQVSEMACTAFGSRGAAVGRFDTPIGVDVDELGRIWVADSLNHRVQVCDYAGVCKAFGSFGDFNPQDGSAEGGPADGPLRFDEPHDVAWHPSGRVAVVDTGNHRIQVFRTEGSFVINAGLNDAWLNADWLEDGIGGQGFFIVVFPVLKAMFLAHFTFDTVRPDGSVGAALGEAGHRWVTAFGGYDGAVAVLDAELSVGGVFDSGEPVVETTPGYGSYTVEFTDCMNGVIRYEFPGVGLAGEIPVTRITADNAALCEALLATD